MSHYSLGNWLQPSNGLVIQGPEPMPRMFSGFGDYSDALAALTAPRVMAGFVRNRSTPSWVSTLVAQAGWPNFVNQAWAAAWLSWRGQTKASSTFTSGK